MATGGTQFLLDAFLSAFYSVYLPWICALFIGHPTSYCPAENINSISGD